MTGTPTDARTIGELRASGWKQRTLREELRTNLVERMRSGRPIFEGVLGYEDTVVPGPGLIGHGDNARFINNVVRQLGRELA